MKTEINTGKKIEDYNYCNDKILNVTCINPTKTLSLNKIYKVIFLPERYRPTWVGDYTTYVPLYALFNDTGHYIEVAINRFLKPNIK